MLFVFAVVQTTLSERGVQILVLMPDVKHLKHQQGFAENHVGATILCNEHGFPHGHVERTAEIFAVNAVAVGMCLRGEHLNNCTAGDNAFGIQPTRLCKAGVQAGVHVTCYTKVPSTFMYE